MFFGSYTYTLCTGGHFGPAASLLKKYFLMTHDVCACVVYMPTRTQCICMLHRELKPWAGFKGGRPVLMLADMH